MPSSCKGQTVGLSFRATGSSVRSDIQSISLAAPGGEAGYVDVTRVPDG